MKKSTLDLKYCMEIQENGMDKSLGGINYWYTEEMDGRCFNNGTNAPLQFERAYKTEFVQITTQKG